MLNRQVTKLTTKKARFLANPEIKRWYDNLARRSYNTAEVYQRKLRLFCETHQMTPTELAELGMKDPKTVTDLMVDHVAMMEEKEHAPQTITGMIKAVKSWLREFDVEIKRKINVKHPDATPTLDNERLPTTEEMEELISKSTLRTALIIAFENQSGVRPEVLGNVTGEDGIKMRNLPDIAIVGGRAAAIRTPPMVVIPKRLSKAGHEYFTFITPTATKLLLAYINERILSGESLGADSPVIAPSKHCRFRGEKEKPFLTTVSIRKCVMEVTRPRFTEWRSNYGHRRYFDTHLIIAEGQGKIPHNFMMFWMGHKGDIESVYTTNKGILPPQLVNEMRSAFSRCIELLDFRQKKEDEIQKQKEEVKSKIESMGKDELARLLELLNNGKNSGSSMQTMQKASSGKDGNSLEPCRMEKSSSNRFRYPEGSGPKGLRQYVIDGHHTGTAEAYRSGYKTPTFFFLEKVKRALPSRARSKLLWFLELYI